MPVAAAFPELAAGAGSIGAGVGPAMAGAFGGVGDAISGLFSGGGSSNPNAISGTAKKYLQMLQGIGLGMPEILALTQQYAPQFTAASLTNLQDELTGTGGQPGYLDIYANEVVPAITGAETAANTATRTANVADLTNLGPSALTAIQGANPGQTALMNSLTTTATDQLNLGTQIDPQTASQITNSVLGDFSNRGLGTSSPATLAEGLQLYAGGQNLLNQRESAAGTVANLNQQNYTDPLLAMMGVTNPAAGPQGQTLTGTGQAVASNTPNTTVVPDYASMFDTAFNANAAQGIANSNNNAAITGALIGAAGNLGSGAAQGGF